MDPNQQNIVADNNDPSAPSQSTINLPENHRRVKSADLDIDDPTVGSFIFLPAERDVKPPEVRPSHEIFRLGQAQESVLILNDYKKSDLAESSLAPILPAPTEPTGNSMLKSKIDAPVENSSASAPGPAAAPVVATQDPLTKSVPELTSDDLEIIISCKLEEIVPNTKISVLLGLNQDSIDMLQDQAGVSSLEDLANLPRKNSTAYAFLTEIGVPPDIAHLVKVAQALSSIAKQNLSHRDANAPPTQLPAPIPAPAPSMPLNPQLEALRNQPITILEGIKDGDAHLFLEAHALIHTLGQLADLPQQFPGMYQILRDCGALPKLESYVTTANMLLKAAANASAHGLM